jgi:TolB-like protein/Flp pilus assembly protein TadD
VSLLVYFIFIKKDAAAVPSLPLEKSIAVLPFKNDSADSTNLYIINGLMEAILDNLQQVEDLKVVSRTTVEKYRNQSKTIPELSEELQVNYFIEGSGQKIGDQILLSIQLIEAPNDRHIWSQRYEREARGIFDLQTEIALQVAEKIEAIITPEERQRITTPPTDNPVAYDFFLAGLGQTQKETREGMVAAINLFKQAIEEDPNFAQAYGFTGICYYYLDIFQSVKKYSLEINTYADQALLLDAESAPGLIAKGLYYLQDEQYPLANQFLEKALEYYPNDAWIHNLLSEIYTNYTPDTEKYLTHAIQGIQRTALEQDSTAASFTYLHLGNALAQAGFLNEAQAYIQKSLDLNPQNVFSTTVMAYLNLAQDFQPQRAKQELMAALQLEPDNLLVLQEVAKMHYFLEDYEGAWRYYASFIEKKKALGWKVYPGEDLKIAFVLRQLGRTEDARPYLDAYYEFIQNDPSVYANLGEAAYAAYQGDISRGMEYLRAFSR